MESKTALTPMMRQYLQLKAKYKDEILFFRLGDFYEMFADDALIGSEILGIALTARNKGENKVPMCGIPYHSAGTYIAKLTRAGKKVAICEQLSNPSALGIVKRDVIRVITPGTTIDENILEAKNANFLGALVSDGKNFGFSFSDLSTGEFKVIKLFGLQEVIDQIGKIRPTEIIIEKNLKINAEFQVIIKYFSKIYFFFVEIEENLSEISQNHFGLMEISKTCLKGERILLEAAGLLLNYLQKTQKNVLEHLKEIELVEENNLMNLDEATIKNLEILMPASYEDAHSGKVEGSLLGVLDKTMTASGGRLLKQVIVQPLIDSVEIEKRLNLIEYFISKQGLILDLRLVLKGIPDLERIVGRLSLNSGNARDLKMLEKALRGIEHVKILISKQTDKSLQNFGNTLNPLMQFYQKLENAVEENPPILIKEGGMIKEGFDIELDSYKNISKEGKGYILSLQAREIARTGINSLKVKYNRIFGYYIEVSNSNLAQVPVDYTRKQTLANAERFSTPELKEYEEKILNADEKIFEIELKIFEQLRAEVLRLANILKKNARIIAWLDIMSSLALVAWENKYCRPQIVNNDVLEIKEGRHPVIEKLNPYDRFVGNDLILNEKEKIILITGPNMGGKSTYLRQNALIVLMAQLGSFVPAKQATIGLVDRIFTRVGASDNLVKGQSTFWVEMEETSLILQKATEKSLLILDEIGRGTSTYDGVSIAWSIMEYLHNQIKAKTLFASHYHELIKLAEKLPRAANFSVMVKENEEEGVIFLYKIARGGIDRSYGIEVARLAGLPKKVISRAKEILKSLEKSNVGAKSAVYSPEMVGANRLPAGIYPVQRDEVENNIEKKLKKLDLNKITPLELLNKIAEFKKTLE